MENNVPKLKNEIKFSTTINSNQKFNERLEKQMALQFPFQKDKRRSLFFPILSHGKVSHLSLSLIFLSLFWIVFSKAFKKCLNLG